jgi:hypothetical protein
LKERERQTKMWDINSKEMFSQIVAYFQLVNARLENYSETDQEVIDPNRSLVVGNSTSKLSLVNSKMRQS